MNLFWKFNKTNKRKNFAREKRIQASSVSGWSRLLIDLHGLFHSLFFFVWFQHFLLLHHYKSQLEQTDSLEATSVFDGKLDKLQSMAKELVQLVCKEIIFEVKARSKPYRRDK